MDTENEIGSGEELDEKSGEDERDVEAEKKEELEETEDLETILEEKEQKLEEKEEKIEDLESRVKRLKADFDNYKKRKKREIEEIKRKANKELIEEILEIKDDLERALENEIQREGVKIVNKELEDLLRRQGVEEIEVQGEPDPQKHEVIGNVNNKEAKEGEIVDVYQKGYKINGDILRSAKVVIASQQEEDKREGEQDK